MFNILQHIIVAGASLKVDNEERYKVILSALKSSGASRASRTEPAPKKRELEE